MPRWLCALVVLSIVAPAAAQTPSSRTLQVRETGGIRRTQFPASARIEIPRGGLADPANVKLTLNQTDVPVQGTAESRWPDGSVQALAVDFNATIGPLESQTYSLQYGPGVKSETVPRGLMVTEDAASIQIGNIRFNTSGSPLVASVKYRDEAIATGPNGLTVTDSAGATHDLASAKFLKAEVVKRGPLVVAVRYSGSLTLAGDTSTPFTLAVEMPNSKSWVKLSASLPDPARRVRDITFNLPLALGPFPWVWDFGTPRWTYGSIRTAADVVLMSHVSAGEWTVTAGARGREQLAETSASDHPTFAGWGHIQGAKEVVAFAIEGLAAHQGAYRVGLDGEGHTSFTFQPAAAETRRDLTVYAHFVSTPVQIGAATSPAAILSPLSVTVQ